jgi:hypothetical protein
MHVNDDHDDSGYDEAVCCGLVAMPACLLAVLFDGRRRHMSFVCTGLWAVLLFLFTILSHLPLLPVSFLFFSRYSLISHFPLSTVDLSDVHAITALSNRFPPEFDLFGAKTKLILPHHGISAGNPPPTTAI